MAGQQPSNNVTTALLAGLAGAAVALLFAPRSGQETRRQLQDRAHDMKDIAREDIDSARHAVNQSVDHAKDMHQKLTSAIKTKGTKRTASTDTSARNGASTTESPIVSKWDKEI